MAEDRKEVVKFWLESAQEDEKIGIYLLEQFK